jgi:hypothetical protein
MRPHSLWNVCAEAQVVLRAMIAAGEVDQVHGPDNVTVASMIEKSQNGTLSESTM